MSIRREQLRDADIRMYVPVMDRPTPDWIVKVSVTYPVQGQGDLDDRGRPTHRHHVTASVGFELVGSKLREYKYDDSGIGHRQVIVPKARAFLMQKLLDEYPTTYERIFGT